MRPANFVLSEETPISIGHGIIGNLSTSAEPVDILSYGVHFRIPRNYIETILHNARDRTVDFKLVTLFPDFAGVQNGAEPGKLTKENRIWRWPYSPSLVKIYTDGGELGKKYNRDYFKFVFDAEANEPDHPWQYGLLKSTKSAAARNEDVYFQRPTATNDGFVLFCDRNNADVRGCRARIRVSDVLILQYQFHRELVPYWQEINQKIRYLVQSFVWK